MNSEPNLDCRARLRERLIEVRGEALVRMLRGGAVDTMPIEPTSAARSVVSDDGREIRLTLYNENSAIAAVALDPIRASALAGKLIEAAPSRLSSMVM